jgi:hypothetical protein
MNKPGNDFLLNVVLGCIAILLVLGANGYFYFNLTKVEDRRPNIKQYDTKVIESHMLSNNTEVSGVFDRTIFLNELLDPRDPALLVYREKEVGKRDISKPE